MGHGFHAFCDGDDNINGLIKNIIHGRNYNEWNRDRMNEGGIVINDIDEWSLSKSQSETDEKIQNKNLDINNLDNLAIPTDSNLMGISNRIINKPNIDNENVVNDEADLLNDFMEEKYVGNRRTG